MSEVFDHPDQESPDDNDTTENTIILSNSDTRYLYNLSDKNEQEPSGNEFDIMEKPDDNEMDNEIIAFVPAEDETKETSTEKKTSDEMSNEISTKPDESNDVSVKKDITLKKGIKKGKIGKKYHKKAKFSKSSFKSDHPTSIGIRSKPISARKRLQRGRGFRNTKGYHASSGPLDFIKKRYKSEYLEVQFILPLIISKRP